MRVRSAISQTRIWMSATVVLAVVALPGCQEFPTDREVLREFAATYAASGSELHLRLGTPRLVWDADKEMVQAYPLNFRFEGFKDDEGRAYPWDMVYWLSGDLRVIRVDDQCIAEPCPPAMIELNWVPRGYWPPLGFAMARLLSEPEPHQDSWGVRQPIFADISMKDGHRKISISTTEPTYRALPYLSFLLQPTFGNDNLVPVAITVGPNEFVRTSLELGAQLPTIPNLRELDLSTRPFAGSLFSGSDESLMGNNVSFEEAIAWLASESSEFERAMRENCLSQITVLSQRIQSEVQGVPATQTWVTQFHAKTHESSASRHLKWTWQYREPTGVPLTGSGWSFLGSQVVSDATGPCKPGPASVSAVHPPSDFLQWSQTLPWEAGKTPGSFTAEINDGQRPLRLPGYRPSFDLVFGFAFGHEGVSGEQSNVKELAGVGYLMAFRGTPGEVAALPGESGWP